jgi:hypothetical protein
MKFKEMFNTENLKAVGAGVVGAAVTVPVKKFALDKIPGLTGKTQIQDATTLVLGIAIGAFSKGKIGKSFGAGMAIVGGYNLLSPMLTKAGLGETFLGEVDSYGDDSADGGVYLGATDDVMESETYNLTSAGSGEMDF